MNILSNGEHGERPCRRAGSSVYTRWTGNDSGASTTIREQLPPVRGLTRGLAPPDPPVPLVIREEGISNRAITELNLAK